MMIADSTIALITSTRDDQIYDHIDSMILGGRDLLCISRLHPGYLAGKYDMGDAECLWLSGRPGKDVISPKSIGNLVRRVKGALCTLEAPVIILDGLEYLLLWNDINKVISMLSDFDRMIGPLGGDVIVTMDPETFEDRDIRVLENTFPPMAVDDLSTIQESRRIAKSMQGCGSQKTLDLMV